MWLVETLILLFFISFFLQQEVPERPPRLFQCSNASGKFRVEEIPDFTQDVRYIGFLSSLDIAIVTVEFHVGSC